MAVYGRPSAEVPEQLFLYPHPLTLARSRAEAERVRLADTAAYSSMCRTWGSLGGLTTYYRYGPAWYSALARRRHGGISAEELAELLDRLPRELGGR